ncbi:MAG: hypothetical protein ACI9QL_002325 [Candidatus Omnitrophota bacterium]|jgi:hypothetical protein
MENPVFTGPSDIYSVYWILLVLDFATKAFGALEILRVGWCTMVSIASQRARSMLSRSPDRFQRRW